MTMSTMTMIMMMAIMIITTMTTMTILASKVSSMTIIDTVTAAAKANAVRHTCPAAPRAVIAPCPMAAEAAAGVPGSRQRPKRPAGGSRSGRRLPATAEAACGPMWEGFLISTPDEETQEDTQEETTTAPPDDGRPEWDGGPS